MTEADVASEKVIIQTIQETFPDHSILAEESGANHGNTEYQWIIDPLDGTTNYAHQLPIFSIAIALAVRHETVMGLVLNPIDGELFSAIVGHGAMLNDTSIRVSSTASVHKSLLVTGFPYDFSDILEPVMKRFSVCQNTSRGVRRLGSAALDICYVACGRFDGFWEQNLKPWDSAAGALMVVEAGGRVTTFADRPYTVEHAEILATNGLIHKEMLGLLEI